MVLPMEIGDAAQDGDHDRVMAWLDAGGSINDVDEEGYSLIHCCACGSPETLYVNGRHVALARHLIALGADVTLAISAGHTALHYLVQRHREPQAVLEMLSLLLGAGANVNARTVTSYGGSIPLDLAIWRGGVAGPWEIRSTMITELLRAGASLDACRGDESAEDIMQRIESDTPALAEIEHWMEIKAKIAGVRQHGSYKRYARSFHRDVLTVRGLAQRGKLSTDDSVLNFLARLGDNGVVWHVLEYWRATN